MILRGVRLVAPNDASDWTLSATAQFDSNNKAPLNHTPINKPLSNQSAQESHLARGVLEVMTKALSLKIGKGLVPLVDVKLHGNSHTEADPKELNP